MLRFRYRSIGSEVIKYIIEATKAVRSIILGTVRLLSRSTRHPPPANFVVHVRDTTWCASHYQQRD